MKKLAITTLLAVSMLNATAYANGGFKDPQAVQNMNGGFVHDKVQVDKIAQADSWKDDQFVVLEGHIVRQVGKDDFIFRDTSGELTVEIEKKAWQGQTITPSDKVRVFAEVDKSWNKTEVEIYRIVKVQ